MAETIDVLMAASIRALPGGVYHHMLHAAETLKKSGYNCELMLNSGLENRLPVWLGKYLSPYAIALKIFFRMLRGEKIRAVEIHEPSAYFYCIIRRIFPFLPKAFLRSYGVEERLFEVESGHYSFAFKTRLLQGIRNRIYRTGFLASDLNLLINSFDKRFVAERYGAKNNIIASIPLPSKIWSYAVGSKKRESSSTHVVFVGSWIKRKGSHLLREIVSKVVENNGKVIFYILGIGGNNAEKVKKHFAALKENVRIVPRYNGYAGLKKYLGSADLMLCTSIFDSGPTSVLEAMAFRLAVVCSKNCFLIRDIASDGGEIIFVEPEDVEGYARAILDLAKNDKKRKSIAENGFKRVKDYSRSVAKEYVEYLKANL